MLKTYEKHSKKKSIGSIEFFAATLKLQYGKHVECRNDSQPVTKSIPHFSSENNWRYGARNVL